jgi:hypothetical protein
MLSQSSAVFRASSTLWATFLVAVSACGGNDSVQVVEGVIDRDAFIGAYVDLRAETLDGTEAVLLDEERDSVLARHGLDGESLLAFVEAYGRELEYMNEVWAEIDLRLTARPATEPADGESTTR